MSTTKTRSIDLANGMTEPEITEKYLDAFTEVYNRLLNPDRGFVYNDDFLGQIDGLAGTEDESRAIYWLQGARQLVEHEARMTAAIEDGWIEFNDLTAEQRKIRPVTVLLAGRGEVRDFKAADGREYNLIGISDEWIEIPSGRIVLDPTNSYPTGVLPKGKRTHGNQVGYLRVLVKLPKGKG